MDIFCEYIVKHKKGGKDTLICAGTIFAAIFLTLFVFMFLFGRLLGFEVFIVAGVWYGAIVLIRRTNLEYEYILTNSVLDIDKIMAKKSRKRVMSIDFKNIEECAPAGSAPRSLDTSGSVKNIDMTGDINGQGVYYVDFFKDSQKTRVYFQPNAKILKNIKAVNPRLVTVNEGDLQ